MPLMKSKSKQAFSHNVGAEMDAGKSQKQALAIAYATKRRAKKMSKGGMVQDPHDADTERQEQDGLIKYAQSGHQYSTSKEPTNDADKAFPASPEEQYQHDQDMRAAAHRDGLRSFANGGMVYEDDMSHNEPMEEDEKFLTNEEDATPFHSQDYDQSEASGLFIDKAYDNEEGDADQNEARSLSSIMRRIRMRNMGR